MTPALLAQLREHKLELLAFLREAQSSPDSSPNPPQQQQRRKAGERLPLSFAQQRLWFLEQLEGNRAVYNESVALRLLGTLDVDALTQSLADIIRRHDILRTTFPIVDGAPVQRVAPVIGSEKKEQPTDNKKHGPKLPEEKMSLFPSVREEFLLQDTCSFALIDLRHLPEIQRSDEVRRLASEEARRPFDLTEGPLIRVCLLKISAGGRVLEENVLKDGNEHVLLVTMHHIICDGWSTGVFARELSVLYEAALQGTPPPVAELPLQYADFACQQRQWLQGDVLEKQLSYWTQHLAGAPALLELPGDRPRPPIQSFRGASIPFEIEVELAEQLKALSRGHGTTLFMTLLAVFNVLLFRYSGQEDIVIGSPIANRRRPELEQLIGFFVNTLALRTSLQGAPSFVEVLSRVRQTALSAYEHQDLPFERVVEALNLERDLSHAPLFQVMFSLQKAPLQNLQLPDLTVHPLPIESGSAKFDLSLAMEENEQGLRGKFEYAADLFDAVTVERTIGHFLTLLKAVAANPEQPVAELPLLTEAERHQILVEWNDTAGESPKHKCLHELFEEQVERTPDALAVVFEDQQLSYRELNIRANQVAHYIRKMGVGPEVLVGICIERCLEMIVGLLGILKAGGAYVPLDPAYPQARLAFMLEDTNISVLLTQASLTSALPEHSSRTVCLDTDSERISQESGENPFNETRPENLAYVIYTSGSTGQPKGVAIEHHSPVILVHWAQGVYTPEQLSGVLASTSTCFDLSIFELFVPLCCGGSVILVNNIMYLSTQPKNEQITLINTVPSALMEVLKIARTPESVCTINLAGEPLQIQLVQQLYQQDSVKHIFNLYGPSEDTTYSTFILVSRSQVRIPSIGRPITNTQCYLLDPSLKPVPVGVPGELYIAGDGLARGYLHRPELTEEKFIPNPFSSDPESRLYKTGDLARYLPDGNIEFLGRLDHQVKIRGFRIELGEIETALAQHPAVNESIAIVREGEGGDKRLIAYVVLKPEEHASKNQLRRSLKDRLPDYMIPAAFVTLDALPLTPNGKIDRQALPAPDAAGVETEKSFVPPRNATEQRLAEIWTDVLKVTQIGIHDNFFESGGHSLLAMRLVAQIRQHFEKELPVATLFQTPSIAQLAPLLEDHSAVPTFSPLVSLQTKGDEIPFIFVHPGDGNIFCYRQLTHALGTQRPVYGLQAYGLEPGTKALSRFDAMAEAYLEQLRSVLPSGPYALGGFCAGGMIALEMAQRLRYAGEKVVLTALFDTIAPHAYQPFADDGMRYLSFGHDFGGLNSADLLPIYLKHRGLAADTAIEELCRDLQPLSHQERLRVLWDCAGQAGKEFEFDDFTRIFEVYAAIGEAILTYTAPSSAERVALFRSADFSSILTDDAMLGWEQYDYSLEVHEIPGDHFSMLRQPNVGVLATLLSRLLAAA